MLAFKVDPPKHLIASGLRWEPRFGFSPDGRHLVVSSATFTLLDTTGREPPKQFPGGGDSFVFVGEATVAFALSQHRIGYPLGALDLTTGQMTPAQVRKWWPRGFARGPGGKTFYLSVTAETYTGPAELRVYGADLKLRATVGKTDEEAYELASSADGRWVAAKSIESVQVWNVGGTKGVREPTVRVPVTAYGEGIALSADGGRLAIATQQALKVWDTASGKSVFVSGKHRRAVRSVAWCPTRPLIATGDSAGNVFFWDGEGNVLARYNWELKVVSNLCFVPDGLRCAAMDTEGRIVVWDVDA